MEARSTDIGLYFCEAWGWGGECYYGRYQYAVCYNTPNGWNDRISAIGPDAGQGGCSLYPYVLILSTFLVHSLTQYIGPTIARPPVAPVAHCGLSLLDTEVSPGMLVSGMMSFPLGCAGLRLLWVLRWIDHKDQYTKMYSYMMKGK